MSADEAITQLKLIMAHPNEHPMHEDWFKPLRELIKAHELSLATLSAIRMDIVQHISLIDRYGGLK